MAEKLSNMLIDALSRAALAPNGTPLMGTKAAPGLFPAITVARQVAQRAVDDGLLRTLAADPKGKADRDLYAVTDAGLVFLLNQTSPKQVIEDLARAVESRCSQVDELLSVARESQTELAAIKSLLAKLGEPGALATGGSLQHRSPGADAPGSPHWPADLRQHLADWDANGAAGDCPLPDLYRRQRVAHPALTIGRFHDALRELHDSEQVYLHPWTGPLYALPEPAFALLVGHEIAYYASSRSRQTVIANDRRPADYKYVEEALTAVSG